MAEKMGIGPTDPKGQLVSNQPRFANERTFSKDGGQLSNRSPRPEPPIVFKTSPARLSG
jgi:hypothetical protein